MRSCLAWLLKPGHKSKTKATDYSEQVDSNRRTIQERIWVDIFKVFKFSMSKIKINNFKMHYDVLECNSFIEWKVPYICNEKFSRCVLLSNNTCINRYQKYLILLMHLSYVDQFWPNFDPHPQPLKWTSVDILHTPPCPQGQTPPLPKYQHVHVSKFSHTLSFQWQEDLKFNSVQYNVMLFNFMSILSPITDGLAGMYQL